MTDRIHHDGCCRRIADGIVCFGSEDLDELTDAQQRSEAYVLQWLKDHGRFTAFGATSNQAIANTLDRIGRQKWITYDPKAQYPWCVVTLTEAGEAALTRLTEAAP